MVTSPGICDDQNSALLIHANGDEALFAARLLDGYGDGQRILQNHDTVGESDPMLREITCGLSWVPFKRHDSMYVQMYTQASEISARPGMTVD